LNYEWHIDTTGRKLIFNANRLWFLSRHSKDFETQNYLGEFDAPTFVHTKNKIGSDLDINITAFQLDMELPYAWAALSFGGKWSYTNNNSSNRFQYFDTGAYHDDPANSRSFAYYEQVQALYANAQRSWKKWSVQLGVRGEFTQTKGHSFNLNQTNINHYFQLFPTAYLQYKISKSQELSLNYSRRINRPGYRDLDPFRAYSSPYFYSQGNPFLQPFFSNTLELNYSLQNRYYFSAFCQRDKNSSDWNAWVVDTATGITHSLAGNFFNTMSYGVSAMIKLNPVAWWELHAQTYLMYREVSSEFYSPSVQTFQAPYIYFYASNTFSLNKAKTFLAEVNGFYTTRNRTGFFEWEAGAGVNAGLKVLLNDKRIILTLNANNLFRDRNISAYNQATGQTLNNDLDLRNIKLVCTFKFGGRNIKAERIHRTGLEEEKSRM
jgi:outer membrane receptor protein involved in Fe transport